MCVCVFFLITAKISPGAPSHLFNGGAGGSWLPLGSTHVGPLPLTKANGNEGSAPGQRYNDVLTTKRTESEKKNLWGLCKTGFLTQHMCLFLRVNVDHFIFFFTCPSAASVTFTP